MKYKFTKEDRKKSHFAVKKRYLNGDLQIWNKNLTKDDDERIKKQGHLERKGKTYEEIYGIEKARIEKEKKKAST